jgi:hypothetical protein
MLQIQLFHYFLKKHINRKKHSVRCEAFTVANVNTNLLRLSPDNQDKDGP